MRGEIPKKMIDIEEKALTFEDFIPSWKAHIHRAKISAFGYKWYELDFFKKQKCWICGREENNIIPVDFTPIFADNDIKYICSDHGGEWWNCFEGKLIIYSTTPYWYRRVRDTILPIVSFLIFIIRFLWFLVSDIFVWRVYFRLMNLWKSL